MKKGNREKFVGVRLNAQEEEVLETLVKAYTEKMGTEMTESDIMRAGLTCLWKQAGGKVKK